MSKKSVSVEVESSSYDLGQGLAKLAKDMKQVFADGWQPGTDLPQILMASMNDLLPIIGSLGQLPADAKDDKIAFAKGLELGMSDLVGALLA